MPDFQDPKTGLITSDESFARTMGWPEARVAPPATSPTLAQPGAPAPVMPPEAVDPREQAVSMSGPPDTTGMHPIEAKAAERRWMNSMGFDWKTDPGQAYRPAGFVPIKVEEAISEAPGQFGERQGLADRGRGLVRDARDIQMEENQFAREYQDARVAEARDMMNRQHVRVQEIEGGVRGEMMDLDNQMARHRKLIDQGVDPWRAFGDGVSGKIAAALSLMTTSLAGGEHADRGLRLFNRIIDREVDRQKYEIETQGAQVDNAYGRLRDRLGDRDQAEAAFRALMLATAEHEMKSMLLKTADPRTAQAANEQILAIDEALQQANDAFHVRSLGKLTEAYDQGQAYRPGSAGYRPLTLKEWEGNLESKAGVASTEAGTVKTYAETGSEMSKGGDNAAIESIPSATKTKISALGDTLTSFEEFFAGLGLKPDRKTGEVSGEASGVYGVGLDRMLGGGITGEGKMNAARLEKARYDMNRADVGANFTGTEKPIVDSFTTAAFEGDQIALAKQLYKLTVQKQQSNLESALSPRQRDAWLRNQADLRPWSTPESQGFKDRE